MPVREGTNASTGASAALFQANSRQPEPTSEQVMYDVTEDGRRFLINSHVRNGEIQPMSVVLNWDRSLRRNKPDNGWQLFL